MRDRRGAWLTRAHIHMFLSHWLAVPRSGFWQRTGMWMSSSIFDQSLQLPVEHTAKL